MEDVHRDAERRDLDRALDTLEDPAAALNRDDDPARERDVLAAGAMRSSRPAGGSRSGCSSCCRRRRPRNCTLRSAGPRGTTSFPSVCPAGSPRTLPIAFSRRVVEKVSPASPGGGFRMPVGGSLDQRDLERERPALQGSGRSSAPPAVYDGENAGEGQARGRGESGNGACRHCPTPDGGLARILRKFSVHEETPRAQDEEAPRVQGLFV